MSLKDVLKDTIANVGEQLGATPSEDKEEPKTEETKDSPKAKPEEEPVKGPNPKEDPKEDPKENSEEEPKEESDEKNDDGWDKIKEREQEAEKLSADIISQMLDEDNHTEPKKTEPKKEARNEMRSLKFYEKVAEKIHDYDATGHMTPDLRDWIASAIEDDKELSETFARKVLPKVLAKNPDLITEVKEVVKKVANDRPIPFKLFLVNTLDSSDKTEYDSFSAARESIKKEIEVYGVDPKQVFKAVYRRIDADGNIGEMVKPEVVETYVESFDGDKNALRSALHLPKKDKKPQPQQRGPKNTNKKGQTVNNNSDSSNANPATAGASN